jgi:hypothetical protein
LGPFENRFGVVGILRSIWLTLPCGHITGALVGLEKLDEHGDILPDPRDGLPAGFSEQWESPAATAKLATAAAQLIPSEIKADRNPSFSS